MTTEGSAKRVEAADHPPVSETSRYVAMYDYEATDKEELSVKENDVSPVLEGTMTVGASAV